MPLAPWAIPDPTPEDLWARETARRELKNMSREELLAHADYLVVRNTEQTSILAKTVQRCACLEFELLLKEAQKPQEPSKIEPTTNNPTTDEHVEWTRDVVRQLETLAQVRAILEPPST